MDKLAPYKISCGGGLTTKDNWTFLADVAPGMASDLVNYESSLYGGYRRIFGYQPLEQSGGDAEVGVGIAEGPILGVFILNQTVFAARKDLGVDTYGIYFWIPGLGWEKIEGYSPVSTGVIKLRYAEFNFDGTRRLAIVDGVNPLAIFDGFDFQIPAGDQIVDAPKYVATYKNHIFIGGSAEAPHVLVHSAPNDELDFTVANGAGQIPAGFNVVQIAPWRDQLIVFGQHYIKYITTQGVDFLLQEITNNLGCIASDSVLEANGDLLFMSQDGIRPISATVRNEDYEIGSLSREIQVLFQSNLDNVTLDNIDGVVIRQKSQVRFFMNESRTIRPRPFGIIGTLSDNTGQPMWEWGELIDIAVTCCTSGYIVNQELVLHGGEDGRVFRQEQGPSFDGAPIFSLYRTPYIDFGDLSARKTIRKLWLFVRPEGHMTMTIGTDFNWGSNLRVHNPRDYQMVMGDMSAQYDVSYFNQAVYAAPLKPFEIQHLEGSGNSVRYTFVNETVSYPWSIQSIVTEFTPNGYE